MEKAYSFLQKLIALGLNVLIFILINSYIPFYYTLPALLIVFALIVSRITHDSPKELFNFQRSEKFFAKGGLRDLVRMPVVLFAFFHDIIVWAIWGIYCIFIIFTEIIYFIKEVIYWILHALIWFLKLLAPFWRGVYKLFIFYLIRWPWWIYRYAFKALRKTFNWNILKVSALGAFFALLIVWLFYFLGITLNNFGVFYIGLILAILPISWVFGEIASIRGQKLLYLPFSEVLQKMRNGMESMRGLLFYLTFFVVLLLAQAGFDLLGWIPGVGISLLGFSININFIINITLILLIILIAFGSFVLPTFRLYNVFNETSLNDTYSLYKQIIKRSLQYVSGLIPGTFFAIIAILPISVIIGSAFYFTLQMKEGITQVKIEKLLTQQSNAENQVTDYKIGKEIDHLEYLIAFPQQFFQDVNHRELLSQEINDYKKRKKQINVEFANFQEQSEKQIAEYKKAVENERSKKVTNQTRVEELQKSINLAGARLKDYESKVTTETKILTIDEEYATKQLKRIPVLFFLSGLFLVVVSTLVLTFALGYFGNFFYRAYLFRNDGSSAEWKSIIHEEKEINHNQPLLSTTLNIIIIGLLILYVFRYLTTKSLLGGLL
jgi:hypothetical protein